MSTFPVQQLGWRHVLILLCGYIALDWVSYIHALHGLNITPWSPAPALGLVFLIRFGKRAILPLMLAILLADLWVRQLSAPLPGSIGMSGLLALGYWGIAEGMRRRLGHLEITKVRQGLLEWVGIIALGTLIVSLLFVSLQFWRGLIPTGGWLQALVRYWVGDGVGILITMPMLWMLHDDRSRAHIAILLRSKHTFVYLLGTGVAMWVAFGHGDHGQSSYFYVLFLPVAWAAARQGLTGAVISAVIVQIGIIGSVQLQGFPAVTVLEIQILTVALVLFGFFMGVVVDEKQRVSIELQESLRLAAAGEMAGALAHELNQPLSALTTYGAACEKLIEKGASTEQLRDTVSRMVEESYRAAEVLRRLRDFFRSGSTRLAPVQLETLLLKATAPFHTKLQSLGIALRMDVGPPCTLLADSLQLGVVLRNLISNAVDAVSNQAQGPRYIILSAAPAGEARVRIRIEDSGPGLSPESVVASFEAFQSTKSNGLGLGLSISRAIVEAHGGSLRAEIADFGLFIVELPTEGNTDHDTQHLHR